MKKSLPKHLTWWLVIIIVLISLHFTGLLRPVENVLLRAAQPFERFFYGLGNKFSSFYFHLTDEEGIKKENEELKTRLHELMQENAELQILAQENESLKRQLNFFQGQKYQYISGRVIGEEREGGLSFLMIDLGTRQGLQPGSPVLFQGVMIGKVVEVKERVAFVLPLLSSQSKVAATVINEEKTKGYLQGEMGLSFYLEMIPQNEEIKSGDLVVTSGLEKELPSGLIMAEVEEVSESKTELFKTARLKSLVNYRDIDIVSVIIAN